MVVQSHSYNRTDIRIAQIQAHKRHTFSYLYCIRVWILWSVIFAYWCGFTYYDHIDGYSLIMRVWRVCACKAVIWCYWCVEQAILEYMHEIVDTYTFNDTKNVFNIFLISIWMYSSRCVVIMYLYNIYIRYLSFTDSRLVLWGVLVFVYISNCFSLCAWARNQKIVGWMLYTNVIYMLV